MDKKDLAIIGGGPGGYLAALRAAQLGLSVVLFEQERLGGICINVGCIPTKYLLHQTAIFHQLLADKNLEGPVGELRLNWQRVQEGRRGVVDRLVKGLEFLLSKNKVEVIKGKARVTSPGEVTVSTSGGEIKFQAAKIILATGSRPADFPFLRFNGREVISSTEALSLPEIPKRLLIIGAGAIGLELGSVYGRLGTEVTILEIMPSILPGTDLVTAQRLERILKKQGLKVYLQMKIESAEITSGQVNLRGLSLLDSKPFEFKADKVLIAAGRKPNIEQLVWDENLLARQKGNFLEVNSQGETSIPGVYAIGDLTGGKLLAHKAYHDGRVAAEAAAGLNSQLDYKALPSAIFTEPELASVGLSQAEAEARGLAIKIGEFPLQANGRALTMDSPDGLVRIIASQTDDEILGAHLLAPHASEMLPILTMAVSHRLKIKDLDSIIYIHPTLSEAIPEAALKANKEALHILNS
ncbi:MAG TPA: dihydrolipoyl dehydrogenase [Candidatus Saccharicenans sp.]|nr:dihydrolipoyl dehydrogenase [Candidatus Saccharicenans sp.]HQM74061.1 dihydrolipoyl dehydrogenase [Candidatus Saccharicenans sp.]